MAVTNQVIQDSRWRTIQKTTWSGTNTNTLLLDVSGLLGWVTGSLVNIAAVSWSTSSALTLIWAGSSATDAIVISGNGSYGGSNGFPAIANNAGTPTGDINLTNASAAVGYLVIVCHKVETVVGQGGGWSA